MSAFGGKADMAISERDVRTTRRAQKEALTNSPGPKTCAVFLNEMKIDNLTIANVRGRLKMNKFHFGPRSFCDFRNFFPGARSAGADNFSIFLPMLCVSASVRSGRGR
jgi:hypothetical protein